MLPVKLPAEGALSPKRPCYSCQLPFCNYFPFFPVTSYHNNADHGGCPQQDTTHTKEGQGADLFFFGLSLDLFLFRTSHTLEC